MNQNFLATKFHQPAPPAKLVRRPHLVQRMTEGLAGGSQLTLVSAPAGFGKTTCVSEWLSASNLPCAWLSLDASDDDPGRFFAYFLTALHKLEPAMGLELMRSLDAGYLPPAESIAAALLNDLQSSKQKAILILDDFHVIQEAGILAVLEKLVTNRPLQLHLVLITREDPLLPLARLRANGFITEIRAEQLRFTPEESGAFLKEVMDLSLTAGDVAALDNRTEGWIAGLQLAGLSMRGRSDPANFIANLSGTHRFILGYLTEEVIARQSQEIQEFLLQTSVLETLSGDLCDAVTGRSDSSILLERLFAANLFLISLDDEQHWYRYHHLFADLLRSRQSRLPGEQVALLHRRASQWYEQDKMPGDAIHHALAAADYPYAVKLIEKHAMSILSKGYAKTVEAWIEAIPPEWHSQSPKTNLAFAWMHLMRGNFPQILRYLQLVTAALETSDSTLDESIALRAEWSALQSNLLHLQGNPVGSIAAAALALELIPAHNHFIRAVANLGLGGAYRQMGDFNQSVAYYQQAIQSSRISGHLVSEILAVTSLTLMAIQHGRLHFAAETAGQVLERVETERLTPPPIMGALYGALGLIDYERDEIDKAREHLLKGIQLSAFSGHNASLIYTKIWLARLNQAIGDFEGAAKLTREAVDLLPFGAPVWLKPDVAAQQVRVALAQGNPLLAETALQQYARSIQGGMNPLDTMYYVAHFHWLLYTARAAGQPEVLHDGIRQADQLITITTRGKFLGLALQVSLARGLMHSALGNSQAALDDIAAALRIAEPEGYIRSFVDEGDPMENLLKASLTRVHNPAFVQKILAAFPGDSTHTNKPSGLVEPLTERQIDVLRLIAEGLKYEEIAQRLFITVNTVRFYVKEIYGKLNVNNRTKAIETARRLNLL